MGAFIREGRPKEAVTPECVYARLDEERRIKGKWERTRGHELSVGNWGNSEVCSDSSRHPSRGDKEVPFLWVQAGHRSHDLLQRKVRKSLLHVPFSISFSFKYSTGQSAIFGGSTS